MIKILYIITSFKKSGPTNQLSYILKYLDRSKFEPYVLTLSPEGKHSNREIFEVLDINIHGLNQSRIKSLFLSKKRVYQHIQEITPDIIHTQGIRPDFIVATLPVRIPWLLTIRSYPYEDYVMKYGKIGYFIVNRYVKVLKKCKNVVACSKNVAERLMQHQIKAYPIQNGVDVLASEINPVNSSLYPHPVFITTGGNRRKNVAFTVETFKKYRQDKNGTGSLLVLGNEPELSKAYAEEKDIYFLGRINNVVDYYKSVCDYFISSSLSEGLPNAVLESLACGLPVILSEIPAHQEIYQEFSESSVMFSLKDTDELVELLKKHSDLFSANAKIIAQTTVQKSFSGKAVSEKYQAFYNKILS
jgi:glycosyltransferase involved in cell wall biosynthesis